MSLYVLKFGGSSLATVTRMKGVASIVGRFLHGEDKAIVVVSAMQGTTNSLVENARNFIGTSSDRECDVILSAGEQISSALFSLALRESGIEACSLLGWQIPIKTENLFSCSDINSIDTSKIHSLLNRNIVPVIAGFQGISDNQEITTLGRGGSDATAVAVAYAMNAAECLIYTDVDGVYTADPRLILGANRINQISYKEMLELAAGGAKVLQSRSVLIGLTCNVKLRVLSSFSDSGETKVSNVVYIPKNERITGISHSTSDFKITISEDQVNIPSILAKITNITHIDMLSIVSQNETYTISFVTSKNNEEKIKELLKKYNNISFDDDIGIITIVGAGIKTDNNISNDIFSIFSSQKIVIKQISSSEISMRIIVPIMQVEKALSALHTTFLEKK